MEKLAAHNVVEQANAQTSTPPHETISVQKADFGVSWTSSLSTLRNDRVDCVKPNEDRAMLDPFRQTIVVADGITRTKRSDGTYSNPSPSARAAEVFCETIIAQAAVSPELTSEQFRTIIQNANTAIAELNRELFAQFDFAERDRAGVAAVVGIMDGDSMWLASIADCWCMGAAGDETTRLAWEKTSQARPSYVRLGEIAAREQLRNKPGNPISYGAFTGEPEALHFVECSKIDVSGFNRLVFATDGLLAIAKEDPLSIATLPAKQLMRYGNLMDKAHQETDDKTIVILDRKS
jgi:serine/threonine protein phosphatase PrpC